MRPSAHSDTFCRDNLPARETWPDLLLDHFDYPDRLNAAVELTDRMVAKGFGDRTALIGNGRRRTYKELTDWTNRLAHVLVEDLGIRPGNRVLVRSANNPAMVACWLAATKAGASPGGSRSPVSPSFTSCFTWPMLEATTARPQAIDSSTLSGE